MALGVEAPGDLCDGGRLMGRKKEDKMRRDETRTSESDCFFQQKTGSLQGAPHHPDAASGETRRLIAAELWQAVEALVSLQLRPSHRVALAQLDGEATQDYSLKAEEETDV